MKRGSWISLVAGIIALSTSLTVFLILANWTAFLLSKWHPIWWLLILYSISLASFFALNKWAVSSFEALKKRERNALTIALGVYSLFVFLNQFPDYQSTFTTWATLILAGTAAISIVTNIEQAKRNERIRIAERKENERLRKEDREENERLRKEDREENRRLIEEERLRAAQKFALDKIYDWAKRLTEFTFEMKAPRDMKELFDFEDGIMTFRLQSIDIELNATLFDEGFRASIKETKALLDAFCGTITDKRRELYQVATDEKRSAIFAKQSTHEFFTDESSKMLGIVINLSQEIIRLKMTLKL